MLIWNPRTQWHIYFSLRSNFIYAKKHLLNHATANWNSNSSLMFFKCWWRCTDVIVGNDKRRGVFIVKTLPTTAFEMPHLTKLLKMPIIAIVKTHYIVFACFHQRKGALIFVKQRSFMAGLQIKTQPLHVQACSGLTIWTNVTESWRKQANWFEKVIYFFF